MHAKVPVSGVMAHWTSLRIAARAAASDAWVWSQLSRDWTRARDGLVLVCGRPTDFILTKEALNAEIERLQRQCDGPGLRRRTRELKA